MTIGPCAKRRVFATLVTPSGHVFFGENLCRNAQKVCPRAEGEGYDKCRSVCGQMAHAEHAALRDARETLGADAVRGSTVHVHHHYACRSCTDLMQEAGVEIVCTAPVDSERTPGQ